MRLIGSFQTITIHGRSGTVPVSPAGAPTPGGTAVGVPAIVTRRAGAGARRGDAALGRRARVDLIRAVAGERDLDLAGAALDRHGDGRGGLVGALRTDGDDEARGLRRCLEREHRAVAGAPHLDARRRGGRPRGPPCGGPRAGGGAPRRGPGGPPRGGAPPPP